MSLIATSVLQLALLFKFKQIPHADRLEALQLSEEVKPDIRHIITKHTFLTPLDWQLMKLQRPSVYLVMMVQVAICLTHYALGLSIIMLEKDVVGYWVGLGLLASFSGLFIPLTRVKVVIGLSTILVGSFLMYGSEELLYPAFVIVIFGYGLATDATYEVLQQISRNQFEHWKEIWSMQCVGLGAGACWGWICVNYIHVAMALVPF